MWMIAMLRMPGHRLQWSILGSVKNTRTEMGGSNGMEMLKTVHIHDVG